MNSVGPVISELFDILNRLGIRFVVGGSFASGAWGNPRQTNDIDIAVRILPQNADEFVGALGSEWMASSEEILRVLDEPDEYRSFQVLHVPSLFKVDVFVPHEDPFSDSTFERAITVDLLGIHAPCLSAEDIVIQKLRWFDLGRRVSDRQWNDLVQVLELRASELDRAYLREWATYFGLADLLESALSQIKPD